MNEVARLTEEVERLKAAIREHRDERGHDRCWLDDDRLYRVLGEPVPDRPLPERGEFLAACKRFYLERQTPSHDGTQRKSFDQRNPKRIG